MATDRTFANVRAVLDDTMNVSHTRDYDERNLRFDNERMRCAGVSFSTIKPVFFFQREGPNPLFKVRLVYVPQVYTYWSTRLTFPETYAMKTDYDSFSMVALNFQGSVRNINLKMQRGILGRRK